MNKFSLALICILCSVSTGFAQCAPDVLPPTITCPPNQTLVLNDVCSGVIINYIPLAAVNDNCTLANEITISQSPSAGTNVSGVGTTPITLTATDASGNFTNCTFSVYRVDDILPTITCPENITANVDAGMCSVTIASLGTPITADNCSVSSVTNDHPSTTYSVGTNNVVWTVTDASGNIATCAQTVTVIENSVEDAIAPSDFETCNATNTISASEPPAGYTGLWTFVQGSGSFADATSANTAVTFISPGIHILQWTITGTDNGCGIPTSSDLLTVTFFDSNCAQANAGADLEMCMPQNSVAIIANAIALPALGQWSVITGVATFANITTPTTMVTGLQAGITILRWTIYAGACCPESFDDVVITVYSVDQPPAFSAGPDQDICNTVAQIQLQGSTVPAPYMGQWTLLSGGGTIADSMNNSTAVTNLPIGQNIFRWTATVGAPCTNSVTDDVVITVFDCSICSVNAGADVTMCMSDAVQLQAVASGIGPFTYNWSPAMGLSNAAISNPFASPAFTVSYTVTISNAFGCNASDAITVTINPTPVVNAGVDFNICAGNTLQLTGSPAMGAWSGIGITSNGLFTPSAPGAYTLTYAYTNGVACTATDQVVANVLETPVVSAGLDLTVCIGQTIQLIGTPAGGVWSGSAFIGTNGLFNAAMVGSYALTYTYINQLGCSVSDQMVMTVAPLPVVNAGNDIVICPGDVATLCATAASANGPIVTYIWSPGVFFNACIEVDPANTTSYTVAVVDAAGCQATDTVIINVNTDTGCTDPQASNYNATATCDDGSCSYLGGDFNGDGVVSIEEFNIVLGNFGCTSPDCSASDLDNDGMVGMSDLLILIGNMGG
jgi:hypothetical protein